MLQVNPRETYPIVRQLADPLDTGTYYVRAVVRNARTDETLETLNLTNKGSGRFLYNYQVPADASLLPGQRLRTYERRWNTY